MAKSKNDYRTENVGKAGAIARKQVLLSAPEAYMVVREQFDESLPTKWTVTWSNQSMNHWLFGSAKTKGEAWIRAWENIQKEFLAKLEE
jgi:hypothetical protein